NPVAKWNKRKLFVRCLRPIRHYPRRDRHSSLDAPAEVIARARIKHPGNPPITFEITYEPWRINPSHRYAMRAISWWMGNCFSPRVGVIRFSPRGRAMRLRCCCGARAPPPRQVADCRFRTEGKVRAMHPEL